MLGGGRISPMFRRGGGATPTPFATIIDNDFNSGNFTTVGAASPTYNSGTSITISGSGGDLNDYIRYNNWVTSRDNLSTTLRFTVDTYNGTSYGLGFKIKSINAFGQVFSFNCILITSNNAERGKIYLYGGNSAGSESANAQISGAGFAINLNDYLELNITQNDCGYVVTGYNLTQDPTRSGGSSLTYNFPLTYPFNSSIYHNTGRFGIVGFGGTQTLDYWTVTTAEYYNSDLLVVGDSKTIGFGCTSVNDRYGHLFESNNPGKYVTTNGGGSDTTAEILASLDELKSYRARYAILNIGRNDIENAVAAGTWQANYSAIVAGLVSVGTEVWHQLPLTETVLDQSALATWINANYTNIISVPATWNAATDNVADGIHPNTGGHLKIYNNAATFITL